MSPKAKVPGPLRTLKVYSYEQFVGHQLGVLHAVDESGARVALTMSAAVVEAFAARIERGEQPQIGQSFDIESARRFVQRKGI